MDPWRIALCITDLEAGGAERSLVELACRLDRQRFAPKIYCVDSEPATTGRGLLDRVEQAAIPVHFLNAHHPRHFLRTVRQLASLFDAQAPQLVQTFLFHANLIGRLAARRSGRPVVVSGLRVAERQHRWHLWLDRLTDTLVARHVCVSHSVARFAQSEGRLTPSKLVVIPNGVDLSRYPVPRSNILVQLGIPSFRSVVTFVGRLERQKGVDWLLDTAPEWFGRLPNCNLLLVGQGPEEPRLRKRCEELGIAERVHFAGWRDDVPGVLAASKLLVLPSRWEGMPNVVLEAMASRTPVLATDVEGVRELLGPQAEPQTVQPGDKEAFVAKLVTLVRDESLAAELVELNRQRAEQSFPIDRTVAAYQDLWESLLAMPADAS